MAHDGEYDVDNQHNNGGHHDPIERLVDEVRQTHAGETPVDNDVDHADDDEPENGLK